MSLNQKRLGASAAVVALSAFVPNLFMAGDAMAQATASDTLKISASVTNPLGVNSATTLNFGTFAVNATAGVLTFDQATTTISNGVIVNTGALGSVTFTAPKEATFTISIPEFNPGDIKLTTGAAGGATPSKTMTVTLLKFVSTNATKFTFGGAGGADATFSDGAATTTAKILAAAAGTTGKATIGGVLNFTPDQLTGGYDGTYTVSITF